MDKDEWLPVKDHPNLGSTPCEDYPGHEGFIPIEKFGLEHLPDECRSQEVVNYVKFWSHFTVKVIVTRVSENRPETYPDLRTPYSCSKYRGNTTGLRMSTGMVDVSRSRHEMKSCLCPICKDSQTPKEDYWTFIVHAATIAIFDDTEAAYAKFQCFYDSEKDKKSETLYGIKLLPSLYKSYKWYSDRCQVLCVTHDGELADKLRNHLVTCEKVKSLYNTDVGIMISHPHGLSKYVTVGRIRELRVAVTRYSQNTKPTFFGEGAQCCLPPTWVKSEQLEESSGLQLHPGINKLPDQMSYQLPFDTMFSHAFKLLDFPWFKFPQGTTYFWDGKEIKLPKEAKFSVHELWPLLYIIYDLKTCEGSSGAPILMDWGGSPLGSFRHFKKRGDGLSHSGFQYLVA